MTYIPPDRLIALCFLIHDALCSLCVYIRLISIMEQLKGRSVKAVIFRTNVVRQGESQSSLDIQRASSLLSKWRDRRPYNGSCQRGERKREVHLSTLEPGFFEPINKGFFECAKDDSHNRKILQHD